MSIKLDPRIGKQYEELLAGLPPTKYETGAMILTAASIIDKAEEGTPCVLDLGSGWQVTNAAHRDLAEKWSEYESELRQRTKPPKSDSIGDTVFDSVEVKPGLFGICIDVKMLVTRLLKNRND